MKTGGSNQTQQKKQGMSKKERPENKDDMDSRKSKVADKERTAKTEGGEKVKTKNPGKQSSKAAAADTVNKTPKKAVRKAAKKK